MEPTFQTEPDKRPFVIRYGLIAGMLLIIYFIFQQFAELYTSKAAGFVPVLLLAGTIIMAYLDFKKQNSGFMSYGQGLGLGALIGLLAGVLSGIFTYIYLKFIDDSMVAKITEIQRQAMEEQGLSEEKIEQAMEMGERFSNPEMTLVFTPVWYVFVGFVLALIIAAAMRNPRPEFE